MNTKELYPLIVEKSKDIISYRKRNGDFLYISPAVYQITGFLPEEVIGKNLKEFLHPEDVHKIHRQNHGSNIKANHFECRIRKKNGEYVWIESANTFIYNKITNELEAIIAISRDNSERKELEEKLEEKIKELDTFIYRSSHDLKGPLASLMGLVNIAKNEVKDAAAIQYMEIIERSVTHLDSILMDLLNSTRVTQGEIKSTIIDFHELITSIVKSFENLPEARGTDIQLNINQKSPLLFDKTLLNNVLQNLIINAIKYKDPEKRNSFVKINVEEKTDTVDITIEDNGEGISNEMQKNVFDMFFRGNTKSSGTGLGLYIVKNAVHKLGGSIKLTSKEGQGTRFHITLPIITSEVESADVT